MDTTKDNIIYFLKKKVEYYAELSETELSAGNAKLSKFFEDKSAILDDLVCEIDETFED